MSAEDLFAEFDKAVESEPQSLMRDPNAVPPPPRPTVGELQVLISNLQARIKILERCTSHLELKIDELQDIVKEHKMENVRKNLHASARDHK